MDLHCTRSLKRQCKKKLSDCLFTDNLSMISFINPNHTTRVFIRLKYAKREGFNTRFLQRQTRHIKLDRKEHNPSMCKNKNSDYTDSCLRQLSRDTFCWLERAWFVMKIYHNWILTKIICINLRLIGCTWILTDWYILNTFRLFQG